MDTGKIKELLEILDTREFTEIELEDGDFKLKIKRGGAAPAVYAAPAERAVPVASPAASAALSPAASSGDNIAGGALDFNNMKEAVTPVAGVFYASSAPGAEPFVKVGDKVKKGDVLCIVEAMKTMNEILSEYDGEIADCCVANEEFVEFNQVLFKIF